MQIFLYIAYINFCGSLESLKLFQLPMLLKPLIICTEYSKKHYQTYVVICQLRIYALCVIGFKSFFSKSGMALVFPKLLEQVL